MKNKSILTIRPTPEEAYRKMILNSCYGVEPIGQLFWKRIISPGATVLIRKSKIKKILSKI